MQVLVDSLVALYYTMTRLTMAMLRVQVLVDSLVALAPLALYPEAGSLSNPNPNPDPNPAPNPDPNP